MITLEALYAKNYKAYKELDFSVSKFTLFIGKNSAGKSSIIRLVPFIINSLSLDDDNVVDFSPKALISVLIIQMLSMGIMILLE